MEENYTPLNLSNSGASNSSWKLSVLIKKAFERSKAKFLSYFEVLISGLIALFGINIILLGGTVLLSHLPNLRVINIINFILRLVLILFWIPINIYLFAWLYLTLVAILIQDQEQPLKENIYKTRPMIGGFISYMLLFILFILFLSPLDVISSYFIRIPVISLIWTFWSTFAVFIYLQKRQKGLSNLWASRSRINQKFVSTALRMFLVNLVRVILLVLAILPIYFLVFKQTSLVGVGFIKGIVLIFGSIFIFFLINQVLEVFITSFNYEMYLALPEPKQIRRPKEWYVIGILGFLIAIILIILFPATAIKSVSDYLNRNKQYSQTNVGTSNLSNKQKVETYLPYSNAILGFEINYPQYVQTNEGVKSIKPIEDLKRSMVGFFNEDALNQVFRPKQLQDPFKLRPYFAVFVAPIVKGAWNLSANNTLLIDLASYQSMKTGQSKQVGSFQGVPLVTTYTNNETINGELAKRFLIKEPLPKEPDPTDQITYVIEKDNKVYFLFLNKEEWVKLDIEKIALSFKLTSNSSPSSNLILSPSVSCPFTDCNEIKANLGKGCDTQDYVLKCK